MIMDKVKELEALVEEMLKETDADDGYLTMSTVEHGFRVAFQKDGKWQWYDRVDGEIVYTNQGGRTMNIYDKKFVHFEWDDILIGKKVAYGDTLQELKNCITSCYEGVVENRSRNDNLPFCVRFEDGDSVLFRFVYYDPLYEYKRAYMEAKKVQTMRDGEAWEDISIILEVEGDFDWDDEYKYRIVEEEAKPKTERLTKRQLAQWLAELQKNEKSV